MSFEKKHVTTVEVEFMRHLYGITSITSRVGSFSGSISCLRGESRTFSVLFVIFGTKYLLREYLDR